MKGLIHLNLAEVYIKLKKPILIKENLDKAEITARSCSCLDFLRKFHVVQTAYMKLLDELPSTHLSSILEIDWRDFMIKKSEPNNINNLIQDKLKKKEETPKQELLKRVKFLVDNLEEYYYIEIDDNNFLSPRATSLLLEETKKTLEEIENSIPDQESDNIEAKGNVDSDIMKIIPLETKLEIIKKLYYFDQSEVYTDRNYSLADLASYIDTNTKYLSNIINQYKGVNYNQYINELKIKYIVNKLNKIPEYRKYKFATLAEDAGFSSPNKFSTIFKKVTGSSLSDYIRRLEDNKST